MPVASLVRLFFWLWFAGAIAAGHFLLLQRLPPGAVIGVVVGLAALVLFACFRIAPLRAWINALDLRSLVLLHVTRFVGIYLLILFQRGDLPRAYAVPAGIGDIIVATMALPVALAPIDDAARRRAIAIWNVVGLVSLLLALLTVARIQFAAPLELRALVHLPLSLLPTFLMPLLLATHVVIFARAAADPVSR